MLFALVKASLTFYQYKPSVDNLTGLLFSWKGDTVTKYDGKSKENCEKSGIDCLLNGGSSVAISCYIFE